MTPAACLREAKARIEEPEKWGKGSGLPAKNCMVTAMPWEHFDEAREFLKRAIGLGKDEEVAWWNDAPERTHAEVMAAFDKAIELAEAEHGR